MVYYSTRWHQVQHGIKTHTQFELPALPNTLNLNLNLRSKTAQLDCKTVCMQCMSLLPSPSPPPQRLHTAEAMQCREGLPPEMFQGQPVNFPE